LRFPCQPEVGGGARAVAQQHAGSGLPATISTKREKVIRGTPLAFPPEAEEVRMAKRLSWLALAALFLGVLSGCEFLGGAAVGAGAAGGAYEIRAERALDELEDDYRAGRIDREEYLKRKREIERGSVLN
jgi:hypothetical protein